MNKEEQVGMVPKEDVFLVEEYKTAWQMILNIDERRGKFVQYYSFIFIGVIGFGVNLLKHTDLFDKVNTLCLSRAITINFLMLVAIIVGLATIWMLVAERCANLRYRKKVNLIRELLLDGTKLSDTKYLKNELYEELGIKAFTGKKDKQPKCVGKTLGGAFWFIGIEMLCLIVVLCFSGYFVSCLFMIIEIALLLGILVIFLSFCCRMIGKAEKAGVGHTEQ